MKEAECYPGKKVGRLTLIEKRRIPNGRYTRGGWLCRCDCGTEKVFRTDGLGVSAISCGCYNRENNYASANNPLHKKYTYSDSQMASPYKRLYDVWKHMLGRCYNSNDSSYSNYGGRGIKVCDDWHTYREFREWALANGFDKSKTGQEQSIDRINVNGNYEPSNCRWASKLTQSYNKRNNVYITLNGKTYTYRELSQETGIDKLTLYARYKKGKRGAELTAPINEKMSHKRKVVEV